MTAPINPNDIRRVGMDLLSRREHLRQELWQKLSRRFDAPNLVEAVLGDLVEENLLSDQRYCESYLRMRSSRGYGPERIRLELRQKGAESELIQLAFAECEADWFQLSREVRVKKFGPEIPDDNKEKSRQLRFLQYRGFAGEYAGFAFSSD